MEQDYLEYLKSTEWEIRSARIMKRDKYRCRKCGKAADHVHHLTYERIFHEVDDDLISVCVLCHKYLHGRLGLQEHERQQRRQQEFEDRKLRRVYGNPYRKFRCKEESDNDIKVRDLYR